ncbi:MAG: Omp28-related outer membrane protein [Candidatus Kapabacteria bacterium]|nr:Omp28-related outer membrane protein [Candidatus Kapabacteria bacterium]
MINKYPNVFTFTHHAGFGTDSMTINESKTIAGKYTTFAPAAVIDRGHYPIPVYTDSNYIGISRQKWDSVLAVRLNDPALADITITKTFNDVSRLLDIKINASFLSAVEAKDYRFNLAIIEDTVKGIGKGYDQKNYFNNDPNYPTLYHKGDSIVGYPHRHVVRAMPAGIWGASGIIPNLPDSGKTYTYQLTGFKIPDNWKTKDISLIAFVSVYDANPKKHKILNSEDIKLVVKTDVNEAETSINPNNFEILPNPATDLCYINYNFENETFADFALFSINGEKIRDIKAGSFNKSGNVYFHVTGLNAGVYFIKIKTNNGTFCRKVLKM